MIYWNDARETMAAGAHDGRLGAGVFLVALAYLEFGGQGRDCSAQATQAKAAYQELEARKATLTVDLAAANTPRGQDAAIRTAFGVARPGEEVIVVGATRHRNRDAAEVVVAVAL